MIDGIALSVHRGGNKVVENKIYSKSELIAILKAVYNLVDSCLKTETSSHWHPDIQTLDDIASDSTAERVCEKIKVGIKGMEMFYD